MTRLLVVLGLVVGCAQAPSDADTGTDGGSALADAGPADAGTARNCAPPFWAGSLYHPPHSTAVCALPCGFQVTAGTGEVFAPRRFRWNSDGRFAGLEPDSEGEATTWTYEGSTLTITHRWVYTLENNDPARPVWAERVTVAQLRPDHQPASVTTTSASAMVQSEVGSTVDYTYSAAGLMTRGVYVDSVGNPSAFEDVTYDTDGAISRYELDSNANGRVDTTVTYERDELGRVSRGTSTTPGEPVRRWTWTYVGDTSSVQSVTYAASGSTVRLRYGTECDQ